MTLQHPPPVTSLTPVIGRSDDRMTPASKVRLPRLWFAWRRLPGEPLDCRQLRPGLTFPNRRQAVVFLRTFARGIEDAKRLNWKGPRPSLYVPTASLSEPMEYGIASLPDLLKPGGLSVASTCLSRVGYKPQGNYTGQRSGDTPGEVAGTLYLRFQNGGYYAYDDVPLHAYLDLLKAESAGGYYARSIRGRYESRPLG